MIKIYLAVFLFLTSYISLASDKKKIEPVNIKQFSLVKENGEITKDGKLTKGDKFTKKSFRVLVLLEAEITDEHNLCLVWNRAGTKYLEENVKIDKKNKKWFTKSNLNTGDWSLDLLNNDKKILRSISFSIDSNGNINIKNQKEGNDDNTEDPKTLVQALKSLENNDLKKN